MKKTILIFTLLLVQNGFASDHWDNCSTPDGFVVIENGEIVRPEKNSEENYAIEKEVKVIKIKETTETCVLQKSKTSVISLSDTVSLKEIQLRIGESVYVQDFICSEGGSGIPANDSCNEKTAVKKVKYFGK